MEVPDVVQAGSGRTSTGLARVSVMLGFQVTPTQQDSTRRRLLSTTMQSMLIPLHTCIRTTARDATTAPCNMLSDRTDPGRIIGELCKMVYSCKDFVTNQEYECDVQNDAVSHLVVNSLLLCHIRHMVEGQPAQVQDLAYHGT